MEPLSATSAALLRLEPTDDLHVGWLARLEPHGAGAFDVDALRVGIEERLLRTPRLRQVVAQRPERERCGELVWAQDPHFALERHVGVWAGGSAGEEQVRAVVDGFLAEPLPRERPLWRVLVIPHTRGGGAAIVGKLHRALRGERDAGLLRELVFDPRADGAAPLDARASADALALSEYRSAHRMQTLGASSGQDGARIGATLRRAAMARTEGALVAAPPSCLNGAAAAARPTLVTARTDLGRLARLASHTGTTLHAVVLALVAGALRRVLRASGVAPVDLRALVPVRIGEDELLGEQACTVVQLPVGEGRPAARLASLHAALAAALRPREQPTGTGEVPPTLLAGPPEELASRLALGARLCNLTLPSARVPARALHAGGVRVQALFPLTPAPATHALALSTLSYERHLHLGAAADAGTLSAIRRLPVMLADAVEELAVSTGARSAVPGALALRARAGSPRPRRR